MSNINVVIADDNERIRQNLQEIVSRECDMTLVGSASDGMDATVICSLETEPEYIGENVLLFSSEEEIKAAIAEAKTVIADPIYKTICADETNFIALPHEAFSGRIYRKEIPNLIC